MTNEKCSNCGKEHPISTTRFCGHAIPPILAGYEACEKLACQFCSEDCEETYKAEKCQQPTPKTATNTQPTQKRGEIEGIDLSIDTVGQPKSPPSALYLFDVDHHAYILEARELRQISNFLVFEVEVEKGIRFLKIPDIVHFEIQFKGGKTLAPLQSKLLNRILSISSHNEHIKQHLDVIEAVLRDHSIDHRVIADCILPSNAHTEDIQKHVTELVKLIKGEEN